MRVRLAACGLALATFALAHVSLVERDAATSPFFLASERDGARVIEYRANTRLSGQVSRPAYKDKVRMAKTSAPRAENAIRQFISSSSGALRGDAVVLHRRRRNAHRPLSPRPPPRHSSAEQLSASVRVIQRHHTLLGRGAAQRWIQAGRGGGARRAAAARTRIPRSRNASSGRDARRVAPQAHPAHPVMWRALPDSSWEPRKPCVLTQTHYNNPNAYKLVDRSGVRLHIASRPLSGRRRNMRRRTSNAQVAAAAAREPLDHDEPKAYCHSRKAGALLPHHDLRSAR